MDFIRQNRTAFIIESILLILIGMAAIALPFYATLSAELIVGWTLLFAGLIQAYKAFTTSNGQNKWLTLLIAILYVIIGLLMLIYPLTGMLSLTLVVGAFFMLDGISKIALSFNLKPAQNWGLLLFNGIISLIMSAIILVGWPQTSTWVIGLLVGINLLFFGFSLLAITFSVPKNS